MRRLKQDVADDLPDKVEMDEWCELTDEQRQLYIEIQNNYRGLARSLARGEQVSKTSILAALTKLKQVCDHPALINKKENPIKGRSEKLDWVIDKVGEIAAQREKVVIFSHYLGMLSLMETELANQGFSLVRIDGSTALDTRQYLIDRFNEGDSQVALCSLRAAGYGINLTAANHVIHADRWWNPAIEDQATDRVHRIGQDQIVYVYRILVQDTLEEKIVRLLERKRVIAGDVVGAATEGGLEWSREELLEILKPIS